MRGKSSKPKENQSGLKVNYELPSCDLILEIKMGLWLESTVCLLMQVLASWAFFASKSGCMDFPIHCLSLYLTF